MELDLEIRQKIYVIQVVEQEPSIWQSGYPGFGNNNITARIFNQIARNMNATFRTNKFTNG